MRRMLFLTITVVAFASACSGAMRDRSSGSVAAGHAVSDHDRVVADQIRESIKNDKSLSPPAHDVEVTTVGSVVTLRGLARSEAEKTHLGQTAQAIAGPGRRVDNGVELIVP